MARPGRVGEDFLGIVGGPLSYRLVAPGVRCQEKERERQRERKSLSLHRLMSRVDVFFQFLGYVGLSKVSNWSRTVGLPPEDVGEEIAQK